MPADILLSLISEVVWSLEGEREAIRGSFFFCFLGAGKVMVLERVLLYGRERK